MVELPLPIELPLPTLLLPEVLLSEEPTLGVVLLPVPEAPLLELLEARSAATQSSKATPVIPTQREVLEVDADGPAPEVSVAEDELGLEGLVALGEVVPDTVEPGVALGEPEALPALPVCASTTPLASAPAASTASAFRGKCFIRISMSEAAQSAPVRKEGCKPYATNRAFPIKRLRERARAHCRADAALQSEQ